MSYDPICKRVVLSNPEEIIFEFLYCSSETPEGDCCNPERELMAESVTIDPELRDWILPLSPEEKENLEKSIKEDGCRDPLIVWNGILVDGHHRYEICTRNNLPFKTIDKTFLDKNTAKIWMVRNQWARRNLTMFQLGELGLRAAPLIAEENRKRQACGPGGVLLTQQVGEANEDTTRHENETLGQIANESGVSRETLRRISHIQKAEREGKVDHSIVAALRDKSSKVTVGQVFADIKKVEKDTARREELAQKTTAAQALPDTITLHHADFLTDYTRIEKASVDAIITDPPYVAAWLENYENFAIAAEYVLKPGGFLIMYIGHIHMDHILVQMTPHLNYYSIMCVVHSGHTAAVHSLGQMCAMKPILVYQKPPKTLPKRYFKDVINGSGREKDAHEWQQGEEELRQIFEPFTDPGDLVLDPFMGSGTTLAMAKKMNRRAIGFDIDETNVAISRGRLMPARQGEAEINVQFEPVIDNARPGTKSCQTAEVTI